MGFTLEYDASKLSNPQISLSQGLSESAILTVNTNEVGRIGILVDSSELMAASRMAQSIVTVTFDVAVEASGEVPVVFSGSLAAKGTSDATGRMVSVRYLDGTVRIEPRSAE